MTTPRLQPLTSAAVKAVSSSAYIVMSIVLLALLTSASSGVTLLSASGKMRSVRTTAEVVPAPLRVMTRGEPGALSVSVMVAE